MVGEEVGDIEESVIIATKELLEKGYYEEEIEEKLRKMKYSDSQIKIIFNEATELLKDKREKLQKMKFAAIILSFLIFLFGIGLIAVIQSM